jgi:ketosteroid isomerase-like protein
MPAGLEPNRDPETIVRRFFDVMNEHDADDLDTLFTRDAEIVMGPHVARGVAEIREIVLQTPPELLITSEPTHVDVSGDRAIVAFRRNQVWRDSREPALEEHLWATFALAEGRIERAELLRAPPRADPSPA